MQDEILKKLYEQADIFRSQYYTQKYNAAVMTEFVAHVVAVFIELEEDKMIELFGIRQDQNGEEIIGLFPEKQVIEANWNVCLHQKSLQELTRAEKREREEAWEKHRKVHQKK